MQKEAAGSLEVGKVGSRELGGDGQHELGGEGFHACKRLRRRKCGVGSYCKCAGVICIGMMDLALLTASGVCMMMMGGLEETLSIVISAVPPEWSATSDRRRGPQSAKFPPIAADEPQPWLLDFLDIAVSARVTPDGKLPQYRSELTVAQLTSQETFGSPNPDLFARASTRAHACGCASSFISHSPAHASDI